LPGCAVFWFPFFIALRAQIAARQSVQEWRFPFPHHTSPGVIEEETFSSTPNLLFRRQPPVSAVWVCLLDFFLFPFNGQVACPSAVCFSGKKHQIRQLWGGGGFSFPSRKPPPFLFWNAFPQSGTFPYTSSHEPTRQSRLWNVPPFLHSFFRQNGFSFFFR